MSARNCIITFSIVLLLPVAARADLALPVENGVVTSGVGWRKDPFGTGSQVYHRGTDIAAPVGTPVRATRDGRVVFTGIHGGHGETVIIEHDNGVKTLYGHNSAIEVRVGDKIGAGAVVALSGNTGRSTGPHVHYEILSAELSPRKTDRTVKDTTDPASIARLRLKQERERRLDKTVESILNTINSLSALPGSSGQGG